ncbi:hypothetical protein E6C60_3665 [Paenibacillus algicola]|uniref:Transposon Tn7 transposition protein TnsD C-termianl domain-containing protein n=1 Tax=Paenibacillus algicola TaxID=2565926 RepID=A0A4P8XPF8_9BACL|nr:TnsD family Tn7-like transposition protein [Paenibacillus algicola]QCT04373.1 hypothetical protein E6C60_3665 [Paenibacillus algicola]
MIFFPPPFPDEILYSVFARYHARSGNENTKKTMRDLFGSKTVCAVTDLPAYLNQLQMSIPGNPISVDTLLNKHTLLPFFRPFMPVERYERILEQLIYGNSQSVYMKMGLPASGVAKPVVLRYCPACVRFDRKEYGAAYWHRNHQLAGVFICPIHDCYLNSSSILYAQRRNKHEFVMVESIIGHELPPLTSRGGEKELLIAKRASDLLQTNYLSIDVQEVRRKYLDLLASKGMLTAKGSIRFQELIPYFVHFHGRELLGRLGCLLDVNNQDTWLHKMLRKPRHATHPIRHILIQMYLNVEMAKICEGHRVGITDVFGKGPWPCLNKAVEHYKEQLINNVVITRCSDTRKPVGTFSCCCGFIYSRRGPDLNATDKFRVGRIKHFGSQWMNRLKEINEDDTLSLREKGRLLGVDPGTIKNQTKKLETFRIITLVKDSTTSPNVTIERPMNSRKKRRVSSRPKRVDWRERDQVLAQEVERVAKEIKYSGNRRVTRSEIGRLLNRSTMIRTKLGKLPITSARLTQVTEYVRKDDELLELRGGHTTQMQL